MPNHPDFPDDFGSYEDDLPLDDPSSGLKYKYAAFHSHQSILDPRRLLFWEHKKHVFLKCEHLRGGNAA